MTRLDATAALASPADVPRDYIFLHGVWKRRRMGFLVAPVTGVRCACGHPLAVNVWFFQDGQILCTASAGAGLCEASLYLASLSLPLAPVPRGAHRFFAADATLEERRYLNQPLLTVSDRLAYLGATFPLDAHVAPIVAET